MGSKPRVSQTFTAALSGQLSACSSVGRSGRSSFSRGLSPVLGLWPPFLGRPQSPRPLPPPLPRALSSASRLQQFALETGFPRFMEVWVEFEGDMSLPPASKPQPRSHRAGTSEAF